MHVSIHNPASNSFSFVFLHLTHLANSGVQFLLLSFNSRYVSIISPTIVSLLVESPVRAVQVDPSLVPAVQQGFWKWLLYNTNKGFTEKLAFVPKCVHAAWL